MEPKTEEKNLKQKASCSQQTVQVIVCGGSPGEGSRR